MKKKTFCAVELQKILCFCVIFLYQISHSENATGNPEYACSFSSDDWCGYTNKFDGLNGPQWLRQNTTSRTGTHPMESPHGGNYYLYTGPTQKNYLVGNFAELESPTLMINGTNKCLYFSYHNRIPITLKPTLTVRKRTVNSSGENDVVLAEFYSLNSAKWFEARICLPVGEYSLVFAGKNYNNKAISGGQLTLTNIAVVDGSCTRTVAEWLETPGDCGFEDDTEMCGYSYTNGSTVKLLRILAESLPIYEESQRNLWRLPYDWFMVMTQQFYEITNIGNKARLQSPEISLERQGCVHLWYYNSVQTKYNDNSVFNIIQVELSKEKILFRLPIPKTNRDKWYQLNGALPSGRYRLIFEVIYTSDYAENDYVAFDNIEIFNKSCSDVKSQGNICVADNALGNPLCLNGGKCIDIGKKSFRCTCKDGFYGTQCEYKYPCTESRQNCMNGGTCINDGRMNFFCYCQTGYDGLHCENIKKCFSPETALQNARVVSVTDENNFRSTVYFECIDGTTQSEELMGICTAVGAWEIRGKCLKTECGQPPSFHGMTLIDVTNTTLNGQAMYQCSDGFTTYENQNILICRTTMHIDHWQYQDYEAILPGTWYRMDMSSYYRSYGPTLSCHPIPNCGKPPVITNAKASVSSELMDGVATYRCHHGYEMNINISLAKLRCSQHGEWTTISGGTINFQCLMLPDCGKPPKIPFGVVNYTSTILNSTALYRCNRGYRLVGSEYATCWKVRDNRLEKWVDWLFVPTCDLVCPVKPGRYGNSTVTKFLVSHCTLTGFELFTSNLKCGPAVTYAARRKPIKKIEANNSSNNEEEIVFYGNELCFAHRVTKVRKYLNDVVSNVTKCKSFCLQTPFDIYDVVVYDEMIYKRKEDIGIQYYSNGYRHTVNQVGYPGVDRSHTIIRYETLLP